MPNDYQNTTGKASANASGASLGRLRKSLARCAGDGIVGVGLIAVLMVLFLGVYLLVRRGNDQVAAVSSSAPAEGATKSVADAQSIRSPTGDTAGLGGVALRGDRAAIAGVSGAKTGGSASPPAGSDSPPGP